MDAADWNRRYAVADYVWSAAPNVFLAAEAVGLPTGRAIDLACGEGRNAVWLAEQGWTVLGVDFAAEGLDKGRRLAADRGVEVEWVEADVVTWTPPADGADLVAVLYLQVPVQERTRAMGVASRALAPGGTLLVVAHDSRNPAEGTGGPQDPAVLYGPDDVVEDLAATGVGFTIEKADTVPRPVAGAERPALDCLVRARRATA